MSFLFHVVYLYLLAVLLALVEVQIEGPHGWAEKLPTWRASSENWYGRWFTKLMGGKPATGYHMAMFGLVFLVVHYPAVFFNNWSWRSEAWILSVFFLLVVVWDFLWFVLNPHFRLHKFYSHHIWWHKKWLWLAPVDYYVGLAISLVLALLIGAGMAWLVIIGIFAILTLLTVLVTHWRSSKV